MAVAVIPQRSGNKCYIYPLQNSEKLEMNRIWWLLILIVVVSSSCVPNKKLVYLQNDDLKKRKDIPKDTVLRSHQLTFNEYRIQPLDIVSITFESLTEES